MPKTKEFALPLGFVLPKSLKAADGEKPDFALPKTPAQCADLLYAARECRLTIQRETEKLSRLESQISNYFIENLPKSDSSGVSGLRANVQLKKKPIPTVENWDKFYPYVYQHKAGELLQRRLSESAVSERLGAGERIPGVGIFNAITVSCTKL